MAFFGLASYLIFIGIYSSAVSVAEDSTLRRSTLTNKRISAFKPRFEKGSSPKIVADIVLEAAISANPKVRYLVGDDALKMMDRRKNTSYEEFDRLVMDSVLGR